MKTAARILAILSAAGSLQLNAATVVFTNEQAGTSGTGFGNVLSLLALQQTPPNDFEFGSVLLNNLGLDVRSDDATVQSRTITVGEMLAEGVGPSSFGLELNIAEPGGAGATIVLRDFTLRFYTNLGSDPTDNATFFDALFDSSADPNFNAGAGGIVLAPAGGGVGSAGWLFSVSFTLAESSAFFGNPVNRVGMIVDEPNAILNTGGAAEDFLITTPEPSAVALGLFGLLLLMLRFRSRSL